MTNSTPLHAWIKAFRLRTLPLSVSGIILGSAIALKHGFANWYIFSFALLTTVLFQILSNLANDLGDSQKGTDNAGRIGPQRTVQSGAISAAQMKKGILVVSFMAFLSAGILIFLGSKDLPLTFIAGYSILAVLCVLAAITYTMGKKAYGYYGLGDLMVLLFFGGVSVVGVYPLYAKSIDWLLLLPASTIGLLSTSVLNLNNMRDRVNDARSGKKTLVVLMGPNWAKLYHSLLIIGGLTSLVVYINVAAYKMAGLGLIPALFLIFHLRVVMQTKDPKDYDPELKKVALATFALSVLTSIGLFL
jgi:1,4-dihydroxy-2-naphthoate octaprenyltransferase